MSAPQKTSPLAAPQKASQPSAPQEASQQEASQQQTGELRIKVVDSINRELLQEPAIELTEKDGTLTLQVAVAGFSPDEFETQITCEDVLIQSERAPEEPDETANVHLSEFHEGRLFRQISLPVPIEVGLVQARYQHGMLTITAPIALQPTT
jgi:HSP20 family molecular chaperone IbpA